jgi:hypothetical protein
MPRPIAAIVKDTLFGLVAIGIVFLAAWSAELFL